MKRGYITLGAVALVIAYLYEQGISNTPGVADPGDTNPDGSAATGTDANVLDEVVTLILVPDYINAWADAITQQEGWAPGTRAYRNNNPGNLEVTGDLGRDSGGFGVFSTYNAGRNALVSDLVAKVRKYGLWTLYQVMARYAPPSQNNTAVYAANVASALHVTAQTVVNTIAGVWASQGLAWTPIAFSSTPNVAAASTDSPAASSDGSSDPQSTAQSLSDTFLGGNPPTVDQILSDPGGMTIDLSSLDTGGS
jgi:hypothetical protein